MPNRAVSGARPQLRPTEPLAPFCWTFYAHAAFGRHRDAGEVFGFG
jgi:hypothetical protein